MAAALYSRPMGSPASIEVVSYIVAVDRCRRFQHTENFQTGSIETRAETRWTHEARTLVETGRRD